MDNLKYTLKKLKAIKLAMNVKKYRNEVYKLSILVSEIHQELKETELKYYANYTTENNQQHVNYYRQRALAFKNKALVELEELEAELNKRNVNLARCNVLLDNLIETELRMKDVEKLLSKWKSVNNNRNVKRNYFTV
ncbi:hypothetical protein [Gracilibacillus saliphilus]|uniref:hypothetical protein n=1 Tax=Gracilibacillus saliphilus TaxID=543890 RepID=UPI0013D28FDE|nr:hypothetical protein [Gracilibacillus saliphilus]